MSTSTLQGSIDPSPAALAPDRPLNGNDRCQSNCIAQAYVRVDTEMLGEFLFCGHHWVKHEDKLNLATPFVYVHDQRADLLPKPFDPATDNH